MCGLNGGFEILMCSVEWEKFITQFIRLDFFKQEMNEGPLRIKEIQGH